MPKKAIKIFVKFIIGILLFFFLVYAILHIPAIQNKIVQFVIDKIEDQTGAKVSLRKLYLTFPKKIVLRDLLVLDERPDTLLFIGRADVNVSMIPLLNHKINISRINLEDVKGQVFRRPGEEDFNFQFLMAGSEDTGESQSKNNDPWSFKIQTVSLRNHSITYLDSLNQQYHRLSLGELIIRSEDLDFQNGSLTIPYIEMSNTSYKLSVSSDREATDTTSSDPFPLNIKLTEIQLDNIDFQFTSKGKINLQTSIKEAEVYPQTIDLKNQKLGFKKIKVVGPITKIELSQIDTLTEGDTKVTDDTEYIFGRINWLVRSEEIDLLRGAFSLDNVSVPVQKTFNASHLSYSNINISAKEVLFSDSLLLAQINSIEFNDRDQVEVKDFHMDLTMKPGEWTAHDMELLTTNSSVSGYLGIKYNSLQTLTDELDKVEIDVELANTEIAIKDILYYLPDSNEKEKLAHLAGDKLNLGIKANGHLDDLNISHFSLGIANHLSLNVHGEVRGLPDVSQVRYGLQIDTLSGDQYLFGILLEDSTLTSRIPESWQIRGSVSGGFYAFDSDLTIKSNEGDVYLSGYIDYRREDPDSSHINIQTRDLNIGRFTGVSHLDSLNLSVEVFAGNLAGLDGRLRGSIDRLIINNYQAENISLDMQRKKDISFDIQSDNESMDFQLEGVLSLLDSGFSADYNLDLKVLNLLALGFSKKDIGFKAVSEGRYTYVSNKGFVGHTQIKDLEIKTDSILHPVGDVRFASTLTENETSFEVNSKVVDGHLAGNTNMEDFIAIVRSQFGNYIPIEDSATDLSDKYLEFDFDFHDAEVIADVFLQNIDTLQIKMFSGNYNGSSRELTGNLVISDFIYNGLGFQDINLEILSDQDSLNANLGIASIYYDTIQLRNLSFETKLKNNFIDLRMSKLNDNGRIQYLLKNQIVYTDDNIELFFPEDGLIWDYEKWMRSGGNKLFLRDSTNSISYSKGDQEISFKSHNSELIVTLRDFDVTNFINAIEYGDTIPLLVGKVNGDLAFQTKPPALFEVDLNFDDLRLKENELGNIELFAANSENNLYKFGLRAQYQENEFRIKGDYESQAADSYKYNIDLWVDWSEMEFFEQFTQEISELSGKLVGEARFSGTKDSFKANGQIAFNQLGFKNEPLNTSYQIRDGVLKFDNYNVLFERIEVLDQENNLLILSGKVNYGQYPGLIYDVNMDSENFIFMNNSSKENDTFFGKLQLTTTINLTGTNEKPNLNTKVRIEPGTNLTYIMPGQELELVSDQGVVVWNDEEFESAPTNAFTSEISRAFFGDYQIAIDLNIDKNANFTLITNPNSGDIAKFNLKGNIKYHQEARKRPELTGLIETESGYYELAFYGLVKKKFQLMPGSKILWSGDLLDAVLDINARYDIKTNSAVLVANETGGVESGKYNQRLDYYIILEITGRLNDPELRFLLDLKDEYKYSYSLIANKLERLNMPENEQERNKQVFALLVTGGFIADSPVTETGSSGYSFATSAARNSVNGILTQQLNKFTSEYIKFIDFNVGVNTYENYSQGTSEMRTDLDLQASKKLFNERVVVEVESSINLETDASQKMTNPGKSTSFEYAVLYKLTETGNYRIKAFRENAYDLFDGEIQNSGVAFIFIKEFDPGDSEKRRNEPTKEMNDEIRKPEEKSIEEEFE